MWQAQCLSAGFLSCAAAAGSVLAWAFNVGKARAASGYQRRSLHNFIEGSGMILTAGRGWKALLTAIAVYEVLCAEDELLSRGFDRLMVKHPVWPRIIVLAFALHLINWIPQRVDPVSKLFHVTRKSRAIAKGRKRGGNAQLFCDYL